LRIVYHPFREETINTNDRHISRFKEVTEASVHPGGTGAGDGHGKVVLSSEDGAQEFDGVFHYLDKVRVEMPHKRGD
jgi:hypothetical protein